MPQSEDRNQQEQPPAADAEPTEDFHGESLVSEALRSCVGPDCFVVHDLEVGDGRVDHIEVNPGGVFEIESAASTGAPSPEDDEPAAGPTDD
jgi:hypothetical protein